MNQIKNYIFDLGGVILRIDYNRVVRAFQQLGITNFGEHYSKAAQDQLFDAFEKGNITAAEFRAQIHALSGIHIPDADFDNAWNAILIDLPSENIDYLKQLGAQHRLFLLSNTNEIHERGFNSLIMDAFGRPVLDECFEKIYLSHHMHLRKPEAEIYRSILEENSLEPGETLFIDDSLQNIKGASETGLRVFHFDTSVSLSKSGIELIR